MNNESTIGGISVRAIIVFTLIVVFSTTVFLDIKNDVLNNLVMASIGWYFGQKYTETKNTTASDLICFSVDFTELTFIKIYFFENLII